MPASYEIKVNAGAWATLESVGAQNVTISYRQMAADELSFDVPGDALAAPGIALGAVVRLRVTVGEVTRGLFVGRCVTLPRQATGRQEMMRYQMLGGWHELERCSYQQQWQVMRSTDGQLVTVAKPRVVLGQADNGTRINSGAQLAAIISYAVSRGRLLALGTVDAGVPMPHDEQLNLKASDAAIACLRWHPDWSAWFDYDHQEAGEYVPAFNARVASNLPAVSVPVAGADMDTLSMTPRYDLLGTGVRIVYETTHTVDGIAYPSTVVDEAGNPDDPDADVICFDLEGSSTSYVKQEIETANYEDGLTVLPETLDWWKRWVPWLAHLTPADVTLHDVARSGEHTYPRYLVKGTIQGWMSVNSEEETWTIKCDYTRKDAAGNVLEVVKDKLLTVTLLSTSAGSGEYRRRISYSSGEAVPVGVAAAIYAAWSRLQYDGQFSLAEAEPSFAVGLGNVVNLTGGLAEWATMAALVQDVTVQLDRGITSVRTGSSRRLGADDRVQLYRAARRRRFSWHRICRTSAAAAGADVDGANTLPSLRDSDGDSGDYRRLVLRGESAGFTHAVDLDPAAVAFAAATPSNAAAMTLKPREVPVLAVNASAQLVRRLAQVMASEPYGAEVALAGLPAGSSAGQIAYWDATSGAWVVSAVGTLAAGDLLKWDGTKYVQLTPAQVTLPAAWRLDKTGHKYQLKWVTVTVVSAGSVGDWADVSDADGGVLDPGVASS